MASKKKNTTNKRASREKTKRYLYYVDKEGKSISRSGGPDSYSISTKKLSGYNKSESGLLFVPEKLTRPVKASKLNKGLENARKQIANTLNNIIDQ